MSSHVPHARLGWDRPAGPDVDAVDESPARSSRMRGCRAGSAGAEPDDGEKDDGLPPRREMPVDILRLMTLVIREATPADVPDILRLVRDLAEYEKEPEAVEATEESFSTALFPAEGTPTTFGLVAEVEGAVVGIAIWYLTFSTWTGRNGIWLEDLYVTPESRGHGAGKALLGRLAEICVERGYPRLEWCVLTWNAPAIGFYDSLGSSSQEEWRTRRLSGEALTALGTK